MFFKRNIILHEKSTTYYLPPKVILSKTITDITKLDGIYTKFSNFWKKSKSTVEDKLKDTTSYYEDDDNYYFYSTQPHHSISEERVDYWKNRIRKGERPFAILINGYDYNDDYTSIYILDGHHKLLAYQRLNIHPPFTLLTYIPYGNDEYEFDIKKLSEILYPWQNEYILNGLDETFIRERINSKRYLYQSLKNGDFKEYHKNGNLKREVSYNNGEVNGIEKVWYENGQLKEMGRYNRGIKIGEWLYYYSDSTMKGNQEYDDDGETKSLISYHENKRMSFSTKLNEDYIRINKHWNKKGYLISEKKYDKQILISHKYWDDTGNLIHHRVLNRNTGKMYEIK